MLPFTRPQLLLLFPFTPAPPRPPIARTHARWGCTPASGQRRLSPAIAAATSRKYYLNKGKKWKVTHEPGVCPFVVFRPPHPPLHCACAQASSERCCLCLCHIHKFYIQFYYFDGDGNLAGNSNAWPGMSAAWRTSIRLALIGTNSFVRHESDSPKTD